MSCCTSYLSLGCWASCGTLVLDYTATQSGNYTVIVEGGYAFTVTGTIGDALEIDLSNFGENGWSKFQITDPTGQEIEISSGETDYSCFKIKISIIYNVESSTSVEPECCPFVLIQVSSSMTTYTIQQAQWSQFGAIPNIEVYTDDGTGYTLTTVNPAYTGFPNPTSITVSIPFAAVAWYIKLS